MTFQEEEVIQGLIQPVRVDSATLPQRENILYLGTWVLPMLDLGNSKNVDILDYYYDDRKKLRHDFEYIKSLYCKLLPIIGDVLNEHHSKAWRSRSLKLVYGVWLQEYLTVIRERFVTIKHAIDSHPSRLFILSDAEQTILDPLDFKQKITSDVYNLYLYSKIVKFLDPSKYKKSLFINLEKFEFERKLSFLGRLGKHVKYSVSIVLQNIFDFTTSKSSSVVDRSYFPWKHFVQLVLSSFPTITPLILLKDIKHKNIRRDLQTRQILHHKLANKIKAKSDFEEFLFENIFYDIPLSFIENFTEIIEQSQYIKLSNKNYLSTNAVLGNPILQFSLAEQLSEHTDLVVAQHGGSYGTAKWSMQQFFEMDLSDKYITYGWDYAGMKQVHRVSHPKMLLKPVQKNYSRNAILYVTWAPSRYFNRNWSVPTPGAAIQNYYNNMQTFISYLEPAVVKILKVRVAPSDKDYAVGVDAFVSRQIARSTGNFYKELARSFLVVCDHNQTTLLESICKNMPTVIVWNPKYSEVSEETEICLQLLAKVGVFHTCHKKAAMFVNKLINENNVDEWWQSLSCQRAVSQFAARYSRRNPNWINDYKKLLGAENKK